MDKEMLQKLRRVGLIVLGTWGSRWFWEITWAQAFYLGIVLVAITEIGWDVRDLAKKLTAIEDRLSR